jgi:hypothetical protein
MTLFEVSDFELAMDVVCNYINYGSLKTTGIIIRSQRLRIAVFGGIQKMSLSVARQSRSQCMCALYSYGIAASPQVLLPMPLLAMTWFLSYQHQQRPNILLLSCLLLFFSKL